MIRIDPIEDLSLFLIVAVIIAIIISVPIVDFVQTVRMWRDPVHIKKETDEILNIADIIYSIIGIVVCISALQFGVVYAVPFVYCVAQIVRVLIQKSVSYVRIMLAIRGLLDLAMVIFMIFYVQSRWQYAFV